MLYLIRALMWCNLFWKDFFLTVVFRKNSALVDIVTMNVGYIMDII